MTVEGGIRDVQLATPVAAPRTPLEDQLVRESTAMASYALASGKHLPNAVVQILQTSQAATASVDGSMAMASIDVGALSWAHAELTRLVAPAAPRAVLLLAEQPGRGGRWSIFGPIRLVRYLLALALASVLGLLFIGATDQVSLATANIFSLTGLPSILNSLFLLCAASVGAAFSGLFRINLYIAATTYDPKHDASYWVQYGLGVIAGVLLATLIPVTEATGAAITRPVLALLGGFSASLIYRLMDRLSRSIESMVTGAQDSSDNSGQANNPAYAAFPDLAVPGAAKSNEELLIALGRLTAVLGQVQPLSGQEPAEPELPESRPRPLAASTASAAAAPGSAVTDAAPASSRRSNGAGGAANGSGAANSSGAANGAA